MNSKAIAVTAISALLTATFIASPASAADKPEKCYGIVKAAKNDCQTANNACAGHSSKDAQSDAWLYLPKGACEKIVGASLSAK